MARWYNVVIIPVVIGFYFLGACVRNNDAMGVLMAALVGDGGDGGGDCGGGGDGVVVVASVGCPSCCCSVRCPPRPTPPSPAQAQFACMVVVDVTTALEDPFDESALDGVSLLETLDHVAVVSGGGCGCDNGQQQSFVACLCVRVCFTRSCCVQNCAPILFWIAKMVKNMVLAAIVLHTRVCISRHAPNPPTPSMPPTTSPTPETTPPPQPNPTTTDQMAADDDALNVSFGGSGDLAPDGTPASTRLPNTSAAAAALYKQAHTATPWGPNGASSDAGNTNDNTNNTGSSGGGQAGAGDGGGGAAFGVGSARGARQRALASFASPPMPPPPTGFDPQALV